MIDILHQLGVHWFVWDDIVALYRIVGWFFPYFSFSFFSISLRQLQKQPDSLFENCCRICRLLQKGCCIECSIWRMSSPDSLMTSLTYVSHTCNLATPVYEVPFFGHIFVSTKIWKVVVKSVSLTPSLGQLDVTDNDSRRTNNWPTRTFPIQLISHQLTSPKCLSIFNGNPHSTLTQHFHVKHVEEPYCIL